ncbi:hypothetical protein F0U61_15780 [Archangium violaceum]|uniref:hypothetical protein n=1 Tax=Archangium violaceum TaxID=83451 RepID=UPI002B2AC89F|nr:hypothetical protein F0U61_15780 [Archangium violaceum]
MKLIVMLKAGKTEDDFDPAHTPSSGRQRSACAHRWLRSTSQMPSLGLALGTDDALDLPP